MGDFGISSIISLCVSEDNASCIFGKPSDTAVLFFFLLGYKVRYILYRRSLDTSLV